MHISHLPSVSSTGQSAVSRLLRDEIILSIKKRTVATINRRAHSDKLTCYINNFCKYIGELKAIQHITWSSVYTYEFYFHATPHGSGILNPKLTVSSQLHRQHPIATHNIGHEQ